MEFFGRKNLSVAIALAVASGSVLLPTAAQASSTSKPSVTIKKIGSKKAAYGKKVTIKPAVSTKGKVKVSSKTLKVTQGRKTIANGKKSVALKAGTYSVTTTVKYKTATKKTVKKSVWATDGYQNLTADLAVNCSFTAIDFWLGTQYPEYFDWEAICTDTKGKNYLVSGDDEYDNEYWVSTTVPSALKVGAKWKGVLSGDQNVIKARKKTVTSATWVYGKTKTKKSTQTLKITQGSKPNRIYPTSWNCPADYPIKGNASSGIYHVPGGSFYSRTNPEVCFATETAARNEGYRRSKR